MKIILYICVLLIALQSNVSYSQTGWNQQALPVSGTIYDIEFLNANTGFISISTPAILKTINGGKIWNIIMPIKIFDLDIIDSMTIYGNGRRDSDGKEVIYRSYDLGNSWDSTIYSLDIGFRSIQFFNKDTGLISGAIDVDKIIFGTTNGGLSIENLSTTTGFGVLFFLKEKVEGEYIGWNLSSGTMSKTTNSGFNWSEPTRIVNGLPGDFYHLFFLNNDSGWVVFEPNLNNVKIYRTQNGGLNWTEQVNSDGFGNLFFVNERIGWAGFAIFKIYATTNGGTVWGTQVTPLFNSTWVKFADSLNGWTGYSQLAHTTDGGGLITYIGVDPVNTEVPDKFILKQNYPNPFNPQTTIEFSIKQYSNVSLRLYDILGKEIIRIYDNENLPAGNYKAVLDFSKKELSSGAYFYTLTVNDGHSGYLFGDTKKLMYLK